MKKMKKLLLGVGTATTVIAPVAMVVSCGGEQKTEHFNLLPTYTGQVDQLIALGIHADYYPLQLNEDHPYGYLTHPGDFMFMQNDEFKKKFAARVKNLMPKRVGTGWWNQDALNSGERGSDPSYWQSKDAGVLLYEHYLLDDDRKIIDNSKAPKHKVEAVVQTNFRSSRDPYTRINKGVFFGWDLTDVELTTLSIASSNKQMSILGQTADVTPNDAKVIIAMRAKRAELVAAAAKGATSANSDWFYNDWYFVDSYHRMFLDNEDFQGKKVDANGAVSDSGKANGKAFLAWLIDSTTTSPFTTSADYATGHDNAEVNGDIRALFDASTFQGEEIAGGITPNSNGGSALLKGHHPIYEQQDGEIGAAPMFEGAVRDNQLYLFNVAWQLDNLVTYGTPYGKQHIADMKKPGYKQVKSLDGIATSVADANKIRNYVRGALSPSQVSESMAAFENSLAITAELKTRMNAMKTYFKTLGQAGKTFGLLTIAPGHGVSTIQSMSKYSFIYEGLGFKQPLPNSLHTLAGGAREFTNGWGKKYTSKTDHTLIDSGIKNENVYLDNEGKVRGDAPANVQQAVGAAKNGKATLFNMDDNGWYWTVGETGHLSDSQLGEFAGQFDYGFIAGRDENFKADVTAVNVNEVAVKALWKDSSDSANIEDVRVNYDLWNEGLKTPFVLHMLLDQIMKQVEAKNTPINGAQRDAAKNWGNYFTKTYIGE